MNDLLDLYSNYFEPWGVLIISTLISFAIPYFYKNYYNRIKYRISYHYSSDIILDCQDSNITDKIEISANEFKLDKLLKTQFRIWNDGTDIIDSNYKVKENPLRISLLSETKIIFADILKNTDRYNNFSINSLNNELFIDFNYFEPKSGVLIEILHDNPNEKFEMFGKIKGMSGKPVNSRFKFTSRLTRFFNYFEIISFYFVTLGISLSIFFGLALLSTKMTFVSDIFMFLSLISFVIIPHLIIDNFKRHFGKSEEFPDYLD